MRVAEVNSPFFSSKQGYLSKKSYADMQKLLLKMNEHAVCTNPTPDTYSSKVLSRLYINNQGFFADLRSLPKKNYLPIAQTKGDSYVQTNNTMVKISNLDGKMEIIKKPWYKTTKAIAKYVGKFIKTGLDEFNNDSVVQKHFYRIEGSTDSLLYKDNNIK